MGFVLHQRTHPGLDVPECFGCHIATLSVTVPGSFRAVPK